jgi:formylglycine-generating enzyme required for sulfatase activity
VKLIPAVACVATLSVLAAGPTIAQAAGLDHYGAEAYAAIEAGAEGPVVLPTEKRYPHAVRGGSWDDDPPALRCNARYQSSPSWSKRDPQQPKGIWWHTDAPYVGFRVVRAVEEDERLVGVRSQISRESPAN